VGQPRKTIELDMVVEKANRMLLHSEPELQDFRKGVFEMAATMLMAGDAYAGFNYASPEMVERGQAKSVGGHWEGDPGDGGVFHVDDDTRRYLHVRRRTTPRPARVRA
jgi:hypothetical protein